MEFELRICYGAEVFSNSSLYLARLSIRGNNIVFRVALAYIQVYNFHIQDFRLYFSNDLCSRLYFSWMICVVVVKLIAIHGFLMGNFNVNRCSAAFLIETFSSLIETEQNRWQKPSQHT